MGIKNRIKKKLFSLSPKAADVLFRRPYFDRELSKRLAAEDEILHMDLVITECCSLKCRDCSNMMQYYGKPEQLKSEDVLRDLKRLLESVHIGELKILGGEPFVNPSVLAEVIRFLSKEQGKGVDTINIITNGTIIPDQECIDAIKNNPKAIVTLSDYNELSQHLNEIIDICKKNNIRCLTEEDTVYWVDFGDPHKKDEPPSFVRKQYHYCYNRKNCNTLYRGKLYACPRQAHGIRLGLFPDVKEDYIDLYSPEDKSAEDLRREIIDMVRRNEPVDACSYCLYGKYKHIPRAVQVQK